MQREIPFSEPRYIAIAITGSETQRHLGVFFRTDLKNVPLILHLGFHYELHLEEIKDRYCWLPMDGFDVEEQQALALWFETIWEINGHKVPYGVNYSSSRHFNNRGAYAASDEDGGLTCATFVLSIFEDQGYTLIDTATSYRREDDVEWQKIILSHLATKASREYIENQSQFLGIAARYRPEEVAGAASVNRGTPIQFDSAIDLGVLVLGKMRELGALAL
ncbi:hypothetical protein [Janthinobacterium sp. LB2P10]|uniref:hypothetical protein n=1 Tax=Janthinobacterium sp. LB2P10 TaxID=3424194 RepID=UPI003F235749